ncbi:MAG TPA: competence/damage-inducible protein A [Thermoanaerobacterales bacterium]|nr:competence/damage-inducible protein A [Thermoanaerobacterales bacterium]
MDAEIISVGTELLLGQIINTNAQYISQQLSELGINVFYQTSVGDNRNRLSSILKNALDRSDLIILTGGLGPTLDDITKEVVSEVMGLELYMDEKVLANIEAHFQKRGLKMSENNKRQALIPKGSRVIPNYNGTAPGIYIQANKKNIILLPGPPKEMKPMLKQFVLPYLRENFGCGLIKSKIINLVGISESSLEEKILDIIKNQSNPTIAPLAKEDGIILRITAKARTEKDASVLIEPVVNSIKERVGNYIYSYDNKPIQEVVGEILLERNCTISIAESCTGGYISHLLTNIPGISAVFNRSIISYSNESKIENLNVPPDILNSYGAVSKETAILMASGVRKLANTDIGLSVTGIAGPGGGTSEKPVGLVFVALSSYSGDFYEKHIFSGDREIIKKRSALAAFNLIRKYLDT